MAAPGVFLHDGLAPAGDMVDRVSTPAEEARFRAAYQAFARPLWAFLYRTLGNAADADDALQEVFLRYLQSPLGTDEASQVRPYLFRIASNLAIDQQRRRSREQRRDAGADALDALASGQPPVSESVQRRRDLARTFRDLSPKERVLLWLAHVEGAGHAEIAGSLGLRTGSVAVLLFRARKKLGRLLKGKGLEG
jgi:RNA polymerase sigma-70 factor (ECF subfamily)